MSGFAVGDRVRYVGTEYLEDSGKEGLREDTGTVVRVANDLTYPVLVEFDETKSWDGSGLWCRADELIPAALKVGDRVRYVKSGLPNEYEHLIGSRAVGTIIKVRDDGPFPIDVGLGGGAAREQQGRADADGDAEARAQARLAAVAAGGWRAVLARQRLALLCAGRQPGQGQQHGERGSKGLHGASRWADSTSVAAARSCISA